MTTPSLVALGLAGAGSIAGAVWLIRRNTQLRAAQESIVRKSLSNFESSDLFVGWLKDLHEASGLLRDAADYGGNAHRLTLPLANTPRSLLRLFVWERFKEADSANTIFDSDKKEIRRLFGPTPRPKIKPTEWMEDYLAAFGSESADWLICNPPFPSDPVMMIGDTVSFLQQSIEFLTRWPETKSAPLPECRGIGAVVEIKYEISAVFELAEFLTKRNVKFFSMVKSILEDGQGEPSGVRITLDLATESDSPIVSDLRARYGKVVTVESRNQAKE